jgi:hypothetical protein
MTSAITLIGATLTMGLAAGVFALFAHTIMPGLRGTDDRTFAGAFQHLDRAIINPWFMATAFLGALVCTATAAHQPRHPGNGLDHRGTCPLPRGLLAWALVLYGRATAWSAYAGFRRNALACQKTPALWWTDGAGQADPSHLRLRGT